MSDAPQLPVLRLYTRGACGPCAEARAMLQDLLEERAVGGEPVPTLEERDVDSDPALQARYGALVPVVAVGATELPLVTSGRQLRAFLQAALPRNA